MFPRLDCCRYDMLGLVFWLRVGFWVHDRALIPMQWQRFLLIALTVVKQATDQPPEAISYQVSICK